MLRGMAAIGITRAVAVVLDGAAYVLVARYLGPVDYGFYVSFMAFAVLLDFAADVTLVDITIREMARDEHQTNVWLVSASALRAMLAAAGVLVFAIYMVFASSRFPAEVLASGWLAALVMPAGALRMPLAVFRAKLRLDYELLATLVARGVNLVAILWLVSQGGTLFLFVLVAVASRALLGLLSWVIGWAPFKLSLSWRFFDSRVFRTLVRESLPMGISGLFFALQLRGDILVVSQMIGARAAGLYGVLATLPEYFLIIPVVITTPILPVMSRLYSAGDRQQFQKLYQSVFDVLMTAIVPLFVIALLMPEAVIGALFGAQYVEAAPVLPLLIASIVFIWFSHVTAIATVATGLQGCFIWIQSCCLAAFAVLIAVLIPTWGILGAATGRVVATIMAPLLTYRVVSKRAGFVLRLGPICRVLASAAAMAAAILLAQRAGNLAMVVFGTLTYAVTLAMLGLPDWRTLTEREAERYGC